MQFKKTLQIISLGLSVLAVSSCSTIGGPDYGGDKELSYKKSQIKELVNNFQSNPSYTRIPIKGFVKKKITGNIAKLDEITVENLTVDGTGLFNVISLSSGNLNVVADEDIKNLPVFVNNFTGSLHDLLDILQRTMGVFYSVQKNSLFLTKKQKFFAKYPPNFDKDLTKTISDNLIQMGATNVYFNPLYSSISYEADYKTSQIIDDFLSDVEKNLVTIVFDTWIWEVDINSADSKGINFNSINLGKDVVVSGGVKAIAGAVSTSIKTNGTSNVNFDGILSLLSSAGKLSTLSHPTLSMISGSDANFELSTQHLYISKVTTSGDIVSGNTTSLGSVGIETSELKTGLTLNVGAKYYGDSVFSKVKMELSDALPNDKVDISGVKVSLPNTFSRKYESDARIKVGNYYLVAGINYDKKSSNTSGIPIGEGIINSGSKVIPTSKKMESSNVELVMLMRPRVVEFYKASKEESDKQSHFQAKKIHSIIKPYSKKEDKVKADIVTEASHKEKLVNGKEAGIDFHKKPVKKIKKIKSRLRHHYEKNPYQANSLKFNGKAVVIKSGFPVRSLPKKNSHIIRTSLKGESLILTNRFYQWYKTDQGEWIHGSVIKIK